MSARFPDIVRELILQTSHRTWNRCVSLVKHFAAEFRSDEGDGWMSGKEEHYGRVLPLTSYPPLAGWSRIQRRVREGEAVSLDGHRSRRYSRIESEDGVANGSHRGSEPHT